MVDFKEGKSLLVKYTEWIFSENIVETLFLCTYQFHFNKHDQQCMHFITVNMKKITKRRHIFADLWFFVAILVPKIIRF